MVSETVPQFINASALRRDQAGVGKWHCHDDEQLCYVTKGLCRVVVKDALFYIRAGQALVVPPLREHRLKWSDDSCTYRLRYKTDAAPAELRLIDVGHDPFLIGWLEELVNIRKTGVEMAIELGGGLVYCVLKQLARLEQQTSRQSTLHPALARALKIMEEPPREEGLALKELAHECLVSPSYLSALFKRNLGAGPIAYYQEKRLLQAAQLLTDPNIAIGEVGYSVGYDDPNYFSRLFKKRFGAAPSDYRRGRTSVSSLRKQ